MFELAWGASHAGALAALASPPAPFASEGGAEPPLWLIGGLCVVQERPGLLRCARNDGLGIRLSLAPRLRGSRVPVWFVRQLDHQPRRRRVMRECSRLHGVLATSWHSLRSHPPGPLRERRGSGAAAVVHWRVACGAGTSWVASLRSQRRVGGFVCAWRRVFAVRGFRCSRSGTRVISRGDGWRCADVRARMGCFARRGTRCARIPPAPFASEGGAEPPLWLIGGLCVVQERPGLLRCARNDGSGIRLSLAPRLRGSRVAVWFVRRWDHQPEATDGDARMFALAWCVRHVVALAALASPRPPSRAKGERSRRCGSLAGCVWCRNVLGCFAALATTVQGFVCRWRCVLAGRGFRCGSCGTVTTSRRRRMVMRECSRSYAVFGTSGHSLRSHPPGPLRERRGSRWQVAAFAALASLSPASLAKGFKLPCS
jgi:hypothetical protein